MLHGGSFWIVPPFRKGRSTTIGSGSRSFALVAQGIEQRPPEPCAGVRITPRARWCATGAGSDLGRRRAGDFEAFPGGADDCLEPVTGDAHDGDEFPFEILRESQDGLPR